MVDGIPSASQLHDILGYDEIAIWKWEALASGKPFTDVASQALIRALLFK